MNNNINQTINKVYNKNRVMELSILDSIVLSFAFSVSMFVVSASVGNGSYIKYSKGIAQSILMVFFQCLLLYVGVWVASLFSLGELQYDRTIAAGILILMAIKQFINIVKKQGVKDAIVVSNMKSIVFLAIATSMDVFVIGLGLGFLYNPSQLGLVLILTAILGFLVSIMGIFMGRQKRKIPSKLLLGAKAVLLIELAIKMFFE